MAQQPSPGAQEASLHDRYSLHNADDGTRPYVVFVTAVDPKRLMLPSEVRWLREQLGPRSHGFVVGRGHWVGTIVAASTAEAEEIAQNAQRTIAELFSPLGQCVWSPVEDEFELRSSNVLPTVVEGLIHYLSTQK